MALLDTAAAPPASAPTRIGQLLGLKGDIPLDDVALAERVAEGLKPAAADALGKVLGAKTVIGGLIPEPTLRRARKSRKALSREMSERLYEVSRVVDAASRTYHGDMEAVARFLTRPHVLLGNKTPLQMASSSSAGADAVVNLIRRADAGIAL